MYLEIINNIGFALVLQVFLALVRLAIWKTRTKQQLLLEVSNAAEEDKCIYISNCSQNSSRWPVATMSIPYKTSITTLTQISVHLLSQPKISQSNHKISPFNTGRKIGSLSPPTPKLLKYFVMTILQTITKDFYFNMTLSCFLWRGVGGMTVLGIEGTQVSPSQTHL